MSHPIPQPTNVTTKTTVRETVGALLRALGSLTRGGAPTVVFAMACILGLVPTDQGRATLASLLGALVESAATGQAEAFVEVATLSAGVSLGLVLFMCVALTVHNLLYGGPPSPDRLVTNTGAIALHFGALLWLAINGLLFLIIPIATLILGLVARVVAARIDPSPAGWLVTPRARGREVDARPERAS